MQLFTRMSQFSQVSGMANFPYFKHCKMHKKVYHSFVFDALWYMYSWEINHIATFWVKFSSYQATVISQYLQVYTINISEMKNTQDLSSSCISHKFPITKTVTHFTNGFWAHNRNLLNVPLMWISMNRSNHAFAYDTRTMQSRVMLWPDRIIKTKIRATFFCRLSVLSSSTICEITSPCCCWGVITLFPWNSTPFLRHMTADPIHGLRIIQVAIIRKLHRGALLRTYHCQFGAYFTWSTTKISSVYLVLVQIISYEVLTMLAWTSTKHDISHQSTWEFTIYQFDAWVSLRYEDHISRYGD